MTEPVADTPLTPKRNAPTRSPSFPYVSLKEALEKAEVFRLKEGRNAASFEVGVSHWRYSPKSSGAKQTVAALRAFGLFDPEGPLKLTDTALRVLMDKREPSPEREGLIRRLALNPPMHKRLWERYGVHLPSHANLRHALIFDDGFNENAVEDFIEEYKATIEFARLAESGSMPPEDEERDENPSSGGAMQQPQYTPPAAAPPPAPSVARQSTPPQAPSVFAGGTLPPVTFPLSGDNALEIRLRSKISPAEFNALKPVLMALLELSIVDRTAPMIPAPMIPSFHPDAAVEAEEDEVG
jgi:hypothetical protein